MTTPVPITAPGHVLAGLSKMLSPFKNRPRLASWCAVPINQIQILEDEIWKLIGLLDLDRADWPRLVLLGAIVGQKPRGTLEQMRRFVAVRSLVNRSAGTAPQLIKIARLLLTPIGGPLGEVTYTEASCSIHIEGVDGVSDLDAGATIEFLSAAKMGGVGLRLTASTHDDGLLTGTVAGAIASRTTPDPVHGFSKTDLSDGGYTAQFR